MGFVRDVVSLCCGVLNSQRVDPAEPCLAPPAGAAAICCALVWSHHTHGPHPAPTRTASILQQCLSPPLLESSERASGVTSL